MDYDTPVYKCEYLCKPVEEDRWFHLLCYYHCQTEMYDRSITDLRSPRDNSEAYFTDPTTKGMSAIYAGKTRRFIDRIAKTEGITPGKTFYHFSAQGWIDQYLALKKCGKIDWLDKYLSTGGMHDG